MRIAPSSGELLPAQFQMFQLPAPPARLQGPQRSGREHRAVPYVAGGLCQVPGGESHQRGGKQLGGSDVLIRTISHYSD